LTVDAAARLLERRGLSVVSRRTTLEELTHARAVWVLNSLIGVMPVRSIDDAALPEAQSELAETLRAELFAPGT
jgi:branched-subunit amino acid aminotransferase/4-amino-4-deoxychorismate lyase